MDAKAKHSAAL